VLSAVEIGVEHVEEHAPVRRRGLDGGREFLPGGRRVGRPCPYVVRGRWAAGEKSR